MPQFSNFNNEEQTPLMKQYWDLKSQVKDALLLFRMGDFYELFGEDAVIAAGILEITLTSRDKNKANPIPMAGVPHHSIQGYIQKLLKAGKKIAIGEQVEDPETVKGTGKIVRREIVRVLTPGVQFDAEGSEANYLAIVLGENSRDNTRWVLACLDASTGEALVSEPLGFAEAVHEMRGLPVRHLLQLDPGLDLSSYSISSALLVETLPKNYLSFEKAASTLKRHYDLENLQTFITNQTGVLALGVLVNYVLRTQLQERLAHLKLPEPLRKPKSMVLGPNAYQHLDLDDLFQLINKTRSTLGARQLRRWLTAPLKSPDAISARQTAVQQLSSNGKNVAEKLLQPLGQVYDLERISGRINTRLANPKDTLALGQSLKHLEDLKNSLGSLGQLGPSLALLHEKAVRLHENLSPLSEKIIRNQREDAPLTSRDGGIFKRGMTPDLDHLISLTENGQRWLVDLENREREKTGIPSLKVRYNRVFGYYIEITQAHLKNAPSHYQRKQTMVGAERFFTEELKNFEEEILTASVRQKSLEQELFQRLLEEIQEKTAPIMEAAQVFGEVDSLLSLASLSKEPSWNFPQIDDSLELEIQSGRHPTVDQALRGGFVPNNTALSPSTRMTLLITGPNMGGKSTVMRQVALIVILGQMGAPVPATSARWGAFSSVYTRIGAHDAISRGQSTFMVEMSELAQILHHADERALIILDEIGRGTSTYDGISVAWATLEWICTEVKARTLFATHYHELVRLSTTLPLLANAHMAVDQDQQKKAKSLRFLYELREGPTNESFGIHVAQLAGLPKPIIERAWTILEELEQQSNHHAVSSLDQLSLFEAFSSVELRESSLPPLMLSEPSVQQAMPAQAQEAPLIHPIIQELETLDLNDVTPLQALNLLAKLKLGL